MARTPQDSSAVAYDRTDGGKPRRIRRWVCVLTAAALLAGCGGDDKTSGEGTQQTGADSGDETSRALLTSALSLLREKLEESSAFDVAVAQLDEYIRQDMKGKAFELDSMTAQFVPPAMRDWATHVGFDKADAWHIRQSYFFHDLAEHVVRHADPNSPVDQAADVLHWVATHIQLASRMDAPGRLHKPSVSPFVTVMQGVGNVDERAAVFMALLRQLDIRGFLILRPDPLQRGVVTWICGVLSGGEIYLFDHRYGMPIPGPGVQRVATLRQAIQDPSILKQMDLPDAPYDAHAEDLRQGVGVQVGVLAVVSYWLPRMARLQGYLAGDERVVVHENLTQFVQQVGPAVPGNNPNPVRGMRPPEFSGPIVLGRVMARCRAMHDRLWAARERHLTGRWAEAAELYTFCRLRQLRPDMVELTTVAGDAEGVDEGGTRHMAQVQLPKLPNDPGAFLLGRECATYWLGLCKLDQNDPDTALEYFDQDYLGRYGEGMWARGARRASADLLAGRLNPGDPPDKVQRVLQMYEAPDTDEPYQMWGNALLARRLRVRLGLIPAAGTQPAPTGSAPTTAP